METVHVPSRHPLRPTEQHRAWSSRAVAEFFAQGDQEKAKGMAPLIMFDRDLCNVDKSQIGFLTFVVPPLGMFEAI